MRSRLDSPGRSAGEYEIEGNESVTALLSRLEIVEGESVMDIREAGRGADLDIFCEGSRRERMRLDGTEVSVRVGAHLRCQTADA